MKITKKIDEIMEILQDTNEEEYRKVIRAIITGYNWGVIRTEMFENEKLPKNGIRHTYQILKEGNEE